MNFGLQLYKRKLVVHWLWKKCALKRREGSKRRFYLQLDAINVRGGWWSLHLCIYMIFHHCDDIAEKVQGYAEQTTTCGDPSCSELFFLVLACLGTCLLLVADLFVLKGSPVVLLASWASIMSGPGTAQLLILETHCWMVLVLGGSHLALVLGDASSFHMFFWYCTVPLSLSSV